MNNKATTINELEKFQRHFNYGMARPLREGIEYRVGNLEKGVSEANKIIQSHNLNLRILQSAELLQLRAFIVVSASEQKKSA